MKIETAPDWKKYLQDFEKSQHSFLAYFMWQELQKTKDLIRKANAEYDHWEQVKYYTVEQPYAPELLWAILKSIRNQSFRPLPVKDKSGNEFKYWLTDTAFRYLHSIDTLSGTGEGSFFYDKASVMETDKNKYLTSSLMEEAIASSQLEGASETREKAKQMLLEGQKPRNISEQMIVNNYNTIQRLKELSGRPLSHELIKEIQASLTKDTLDHPEYAGRYRMDSDDILVADPRDNEVLFVPPPAGQVMNRLEGLFSFANQKESGEQFVHPVVKAIIIHFWLAYIHPFCDGNGRTSRALFYWYLLRNGYWKFEYLSVSRIIKNAHAQYARAFLYSETDENDLTYFIMYNLKVINRSIEEFEAYISRKKQEIGSTLEAVKKYPDINFRQQDLLGRAIREPAVRYTAGMCAKIYRVTHMTALSDLRGLVKRDLFVELSAGRQHFFQPVKEIREKLR